MGKIHVKLQCSSEFQNTTHRCFSIPSLFEPLWCLWPFVEVAIGTKIVVKRDHLMFVHVVCTYHVWSNVE